MTAQTHLQTDAQVIRRPICKQLPQEILHIIFQLVLPPSFFLDPALYRGPQSPWCQSLRSKKALVSVCKAWWCAGVDMLYAEIVLRRVGQVPALIRTLESPDNDFRNSVKAMSA